MRMIFLLAAAASAPLAWGSAAAPPPPEADKALARDLLKTLVEINNTHSHGSNEAAGHRREPRASGYARTMSPSNSRIG